jgi:hypothetical protein
MSIFSKSMPSPGVCRPERARTLAFAESRLSEGWFLIRSGLLDGALVASIAPLNASATGCPRTSHRAHVTVELPAAESLILALRQKLASAMARSELAVELRVREYRGIRGEVEGGPDAVSRVGLPAPSNAPTRRRFNVAGPSYP